MIAEGEEELICDFAETYGVYDWRSLPLETAATLAAGLRENSRIKMLMRGERTDFNTLLLAAAVDRLTFLVWSKTKDGQKNRNRPKSILDGICKQEKQSDILAFSTPEEFRKELDKFRE